MTKKKVGIIGAGRLGKSVEAIIRKAGGETRSWDKFAEGTAKTAKEVTEWADIVLFCVPSWNMRDAITEVCTFIPKKTAIATFSKGIEAGTGKDCHSVLCDYFDSKRVAFIAGPMLAKELAEGRQGHVVVSSRSKKTAGGISGIFADSHIKAETGDDPRGAALAGVLKNIYTIGMGIIDGLGLGVNAQGKYFADAFGEMRGLMPLLGEKEKTLFGPAGLADFAATAWSSSSVNKQAGEGLARGDWNVQSEGIATLPEFLKLVGKKYKKFPLLAKVVSVVIDKKPASVVFV